MNKKIVIGILILVICIIACILIFVLGDNENKTLNTNNSQSEVNNGNVKISDGKVLVVYYSAQNHTEAVAKILAENLNADIFEIVPVDEYTSEDLDWTDDSSRVSMEYSDESLRNVELVSTKVDNWESYDTVLIGYPIWWGVAAWPTNTFVKANDFNGKTVIPFCTSSSSSIGDSGKLLEEQANGSNWLEGHRFSSNASEDEIISWINSL